jgi:ATP-binding cassette, subfamily C, bacterial
MTDSRGLRPDAAPAGPAATSDATSEPYGWRWLLQSCRPFRATLLRANLLGLLAALASVPIPLLMPLLVDEVLLGHPGTTVKIIDSLFPPAWHGPVLYIVFTLGAAAVLRLLALGLQVIQTWDYTQVAKAITYELRSNLLLRLERVAMSEYETLGSGAITAHFVSDIGSVDDFVGVTVGRFMVAALTLAGTAVVLFWMHWQLALVIVLLNPVVVYLTLVMGRRIKELKRRENQALELFQDALTETLEAMQQIRAASRDGWFLDRVRGRAAEVRNSAREHAWRSDAAQRLAFAVFILGFEVFRALSMLMVVYSDLSVGQMTAVFGYLWFMMTPLQDVLSMQGAWFSASAAFRRLNRLTELAEEPVWPTIENPFIGRRTVAISVRDVHFSYSGGAPVLDGVDLEVAAGEKVALVGASGGGKSTLVQVILGLYTPQSGQVCFNGVATDRIGATTVRQHVSVVLQHPALFNDSIRANLTLGRDFPDSALWEALEVADLAELVRDQPGGLDTRVGKQGVRLSGGQRQRLAIARMVLTAPSVVILDEATSALDAATEERVLDRLEAFLAGRTTLIIAHRLSAVRRADRACVFDGGRIIEQGRHQELLASEGLYKRLYGSQV